CFPLPRSRAFSLFPYTTLFRSRPHTRRAGARRHVCRSPHLTAMPISGPVPEWLLSAVAALTLFAVMFDLGLVIVPEEFRWVAQRDRKSTRLNSSHEWTSYAVFC